VANPEHDLISRIMYRPESLASVLEAHIGSEHFHDETHGEVWDWVQSFVAQYGKVPGRDTLRAQFPTYELVKVPEPIDYYVDSLVQAHKRYLVYNVVSDAAAAVKSEDYDGALGAMSDGLMEIGLTTSKTVDENIIETWEPRLERYDEIAEGAGEMVGIPTGFRSIDVPTGGLQPEQFIVVIGPNKGGKSGLLMAMAIAANDAGKSLLFFSFEMSNEEQVARHDSLRAHFDYQKILQGRMTPQERRALSDSLKAIKNNAPMVFIHDMSSTTTLGAVSAKVAQYKPDIVFVDGLYLMDSEIPGVESTDTKSLTKISRGLKRMAQREKIIVVASTQVLDWKWSSKKGLTTGSVGYTSALGQDCDLMIGIEPPENDGEMAKLRRVAGRNVGRGEALLSMDWANGRIEERTLGSGGDDGDDDGL